MENTDYGGGGKRMDFNFFCFAPKITALFEIFNLDCEGMREGEKEASSIGLFAPNACISQVWLGPKPGSRVPRMGGRHPVPEPSPAACEGATSQDAGTEREGSWVSGPSRLTWDAGVPRGSPMLYRHTACPNPPSCPSAQLWITL